VIRILARANKTLLIWGLLDAFYIVWYSLMSWKDGRIPFITDLSNTLALSAELAGTNMAVAAISWLLQFSIIVSAVLFLCGYRWARYLGFAQIPFRLLLVYPSVSLILVAGGYWSDHQVLLVVLVLASEALKAWSLWRLA
jgi:hypothetical protein